MDSFAVLKKRGRNLMSNVMRDFPHHIRLQILDDYKRFEKLLNELQLDYPNATIKEVETLAVNRLRHQDLLYREYIKSNKRSRNEYTAQFFYVMDRISDQYPCLHHEVARQINKKLQSEQILITLSVFQEIFNTDLMQFVLSEKENQIRANHFLSKHAKSG